MAGEPGSDGNLGNNARAQASFEMAAVYGVVILIIAIAAALTYHFISVTGTPENNLCSFSGYVNCRSILLGSNGISSQAIFVLDNAEQYAISNASATISLQGIGVFSGACQPSFVLPGGSMECSIPISKKITQSQLYNGSVTFTTNICTKFSSQTCLSPVNQSIGGRFSGIAKGTIPSYSCSITLSSPANVFLAGAEVYKINANLKVAGTNETGGSIKFTSPPGVTVSPEYSNTDSGGNASAIVYSSSPISANIIVSYGNCSSALLMDFVAPIYVKFASNSPGNQHLIAGNSIYSVLPQTVVMPSGSHLNYTYSTVITNSTATRYLLSSVSGCGSSSEKGIIVAASNCTITGNYITQYYLGIYSSQGGTVGPSSGWYDSGNVLTLGANSLSGYTFNGWTCTGSGCYSGGITNPEITLTAAVSETASFAPSQQGSTHQFMLSAAATPSWDANVTGSGIYNGSAKAIVTAAPLPGYYLKNWTCTGAGCYSGNSLSFNVILYSNTTETADITPIHPGTLLVNVSIPGAATVLGHQYFLNNFSTNYGGPGTYANGTNVYFGVTYPGINYAFTNWTCTGANCYSGSGYTRLPVYLSGVGPTGQPANLYNLTLFGDVTETALFTRVYYLATHSSKGGGITIKDQYGTYSAPRAFSYPANSQITINAIPISNSSFVDWTCSGTGCYSGPNQTASFLIRSNLTENATFINTTLKLHPDYVFLNTSSNPFFVGNVFGAGIYPPSTPEPISANVLPSYAGAYRFANWTCTGAGCYSGKNNSASAFTDSNILETANFRPFSPETLSVLISPSIISQLNPSTTLMTSSPGSPYQGPGTYPKGSNIYFGIVNISNVPGYAFANWTCTGAGCYSGLGAISVAFDSPSGYAVSSWNLTLDSNITEIANFAKSYNALIRASAGGNFTFTTSSGGNVLQQGNPGNYLVLQDFNGEGLSLDAIPNNGFSLKNWTCTGTGCYSGTNATGSMIIAGNITEFANFAKN